MGKVLSRWEHSQPRAPVAEPQLKVCPRCGQPVSYLERHRRNGHVYLYAAHYLGYRKGPDGRVYKKVRRCYLGPEGSPAVSVSYTAAEPQVGSVYERLSLLTGLPADEVERQIRELLEAERRLRELQGA